MLRRERGCCLIFLTISGTWIPYSRKQHFDYCDFSWPIQARKVAGKAKVEQYGYIWERSFSRDCVFASYLYYLFNIHCSVDRVLLILFFSILNNMRKLIYPLCYAFSLPKGGWKKGLCDFFSVYLPIRSTITTRYGLRNNYIHPQKRSIHHCKQKSIVITFRRGFCFAACPAQATGWWAAV